MGGIGKRERMKKKMAIFWFLTANPDPSSIIELISDNFLRVKETIIYLVLGRKENERKRV